MESYTFLSSSRLRIIIYMILLVILLFHASLFSGASKIIQRQVHEESLATPTKEAVGTYSRSRKMVRNGLCTKRDISISQSRGSTTGIPEYIVQIENTCMSGCAPFNIHLHCGWFASARIVNPNTFKRLSFDDCLVNAGRPLRSSQIIRFTYSNSFMYPLDFKSARFC